MTSIQLKEEALKLPVEERRSLAEALWESVDEEEGLSWSERELVESRLAGYERDPGRVLSWGQIEERVRGELARRRA